LIFSLLFDLKMQNAADRLTAFSQPRRRVMDKSVFQTKWRKNVSKRHAASRGEPMTMTPVTTTTLLMDGLSSMQQAQKLTFDYVSIVILLILLAVPIACIALMIKLDSPGPVFFRQPRIGLNNRVFEIWKFRTMYHKDTDISGAQLTRPNDPRITRVGAWLRKWSIDEVAQIINVAMGEMSLVGPRPHPIEASVGGHRYCMVAQDYASRHCVKPGITGWAQINGWRGETITVRQITQRVAYDMEYIENWSLWFDIRIIMLTVMREIPSHCAF
jgi:polysaccharide biosynthesis protein PslA